MAIYVRALVFALLLCYVSTMPVEEQKVDTQVDLLAVESVPQAEIESAVNDDISRTKRQCEYLKTRLRLRILLRQNKFLITFLESVVTCFFGLMVPSIFLVRRF